ncbi:TetR family transcriptional regulator [Bacillus cereus]|nr:TetR family transcriptional regulator [Bacillus cereus]
MSLKWEMELEEQRNKRRKEVLEAARKLFIEKNFPQVTMNDIASEAGISKVTLYKYYKSIDEIAFELQYLLFLDMGNFFGNSSDDIPASEQILMFIKRWSDFLSAREDILRFQAIFDLYYRVQYLDITQVDSRQELIRRSREDLGSLFVRGQNEGNIRTDIQAKELAAWTINNLIAMVHRLAARGELLEKDSFVSKERIMEMTIESIINFIQKS